MFQQMFYFMFLPSLWEVKGERRGEMKDESIIWANNKSVWSVNNVET